MSSFLRRAVVIVKVRSQFCAPGGVAANIVYAWPADFGRRLQSTQGVWPRARESAARRGPYDAESSETVVGQTGRPGFCASTNHSAHSPGPCSANARAKTTLGIWVSCFIFRGLGMNAFLVPFSWVEITTKWVSKVRFFTTLLS